MPGPRAEGIGLAGEADAPATLPRHVAAAVGLAPPRMQNDSLESLAAAYEASLPGKVGSLANLAQKIEAGELSFAEQSKSLLRRLHKLKGQAGMLGYPLLGQIAGWLHDLLRPSMAHLDAVAPLQSDINRVLRIGTAAIALLAERKLRGNGGTTGTRIHQQLGSFADDLRKRIDMAIAAAETQQRAARDQHAVRRAEITADQWTLHGLVYRGDQPKS